MDELTAWTCADQEGLAAAEGNGPEAERGDLKGLIGGIGQTDDLRLLGSGDAVQGVSAVGVANDSTSHTVTFPSTCPLTMYFLESSSRVAQTSVNGTPLQPLRTPSQ